ncbi:MAG: histidine phosphatase family protein [Parasphingorhabdus sp.]|uniref:histidine phosphatase family protein n=1 Tax=Parasphingorhabdus sp. TaxID=2709688 RepID=UPI00300184D5
MKTKTFHMMRHGEPEIAGLLLGITDMASMAVGNCACVARAEELEISELISSDLARATVPAQEIAVRHNAPLKIDARWRELDFGAWDGMSPAIVDASALHAFWDDPTANPPPKGESWSVLSARVEAALLDISHGTLVVAHAGSIRAALCHLLGLSYRQAWAFHLPYAALVSLKIWTGQDVPTAQITGLRT